MRAGRLEEILFGNENLIVRGVNNPIFATKWLIMDFVRKFPNIEVIKLSVVNGKLNVFVYDTTAQALHEKRYEDVMKYSKELEYHVFDSDIEYIKVRGKGIITEKNMYDMRDIEYVLNKIEKSKSRPFIMANEELADKIFPYVKEKYPGALLFKLEEQQYILISNRGKNKLLKILQKRKELLEKVIKKLENMISELIDN